MKVGQTYLFKVGRKSFLFQWGILCQRLHGVRAELGHRRFYLSMQG